MVNNTGRRRSVFDRIAEDDVFQTISIIAFQRVEAFVVALNAYNAS